MVMYVVSENDTIAHGSMQNQVLNHQAISLLTSDAIKNSMSNFFSTESIISQMWVIRTETSMVTFNFKIIKHVSFAPFLPNSI